MQLCACKVEVGLSIWQRIYFKKLKQCVVLLKVLKVLLNLGNTGSSCFTFSVSCGCLCEMFLCSVCDFCL